MFDSIGNFFRSIKYGTENLILWFPVIWKDRNWDHVYLYEILRQKLTLMETCLRTFGHHVDAEKDADNIKVCKLLLTRLIEDVYHDAAFKKHYEKWGEPEMLLHDTEKDGLKELQITHKNVKTEEDEKNQSKDFKRCVEYEDLLKNQDLDLLFKIMRKHVQSWWD